ncbi:MAG: DUF84 family protein [Christensenellaceae bacterium]|jgi:inosine/xanthosine triphosphatase|nr:DUF84 family protein [Christensenellaceae bacterium]
MIIGIGSRAESKVGAIGKSFARYSDIWLERMEKSDEKHPITQGRGHDRIEYVLLPKDLREPVTGNSTDKVSKVSTNPITLDETVLGAKNRANITWDYFSKQGTKCDYTVGLEGGCFKVGDEYFMLGAAVIHDGKNFFVGLSPAFPMPNVIMKDVLKGTECGHLGEIFGVKTLKGRDGIVNQLTKGRMNREELESHAVLMALTKVVSSQYF